MFINNIDPVLLNLGPFEIRYYGIIYAFGFLIAYLYLRQNIKILRLKQEELDNLFIIILIANIIGARLFEVIFYNPVYYLSHPLEILMIWHGGLSFFGGLLGISFAGLWFCKKHKIPFYDLADLLVLPAALALFFGRIANFINSEHYGTIADPLRIKWCVVFSRIDDYCRHPSQLYESLKNLLIFGVLVFYRNHFVKSKNYIKGTIFWMFIFMYGILRFITNFYRHDLLYYGLSLNQYLSLAAAIIGAIFLLKNYREYLKKRK
jgi:phosphatidylglycerol:prolipoprotein diacylglycerol transferase